MNCPKCTNVETKVIDSRIIDNGSTVRRRRECEYCEYRYTTFERREMPDILVIKKDGTKELYDRQKLKRAIVLAFAKKKDIPSDDIDSMITTLEGSRLSESGEITSRQIGDDVVTALKGIDPVAYLRFASVYKEFHSLEDFRVLL